MLINGVAAPLLFVREDQINLVVPAGVSLPWAGITVSTPQGSSAQFLTWMEAATTALFTIAGSGIGQGCILNQDGTVNSKDNPAARGSAVTLYGTGGLTTPSLADGAVSLGPAELVCAQFMQATVGGSAATVQYAGAAPFLVNGAMQINIQLPTDVSTGLSVPVSLFLYPLYSQAGVTIAIK